MKEKYVPVEAPLKCFCGNMVRPRNMRAEVLMYRKQYKHRFRLTQRTWIVGCVKCGFCRTSNTKRNAIKAFVRAGKRMPWLWQKYKPE